MGEPMTIDEARRVAAALAALTDGDSWSREPLRSIADALAAALAEVDRLTAAYDLVTSVSRSAGNAASNALAAEVDRLRSLPVIPCCAECAHCVKGSARHRCEHPAAPLDDAGKAHAAGRRGPMGQCRTVEPDGEPPSWCPWRKAGGR